MPSRGKPSRSIATRRQRADGSALCPPRRTRRAAGRHRVALAGVFVLDENISAPGAKDCARGASVSATSARPLAEYGTDDADLIPILHRLPRPTFFTHDADFWTPHLCHPAYCVVFLDVEDTEAAGYIRRFLRHPDFETHAARLGKVIQARSTGLTFYDSRYGKAKPVSWLRAV